MHFGWVNNPEEVQRQLTQLPKPLFGNSLQPKTNDADTLLYKIVRSVINQDAPKGPQGIGDCVSWATANFVNYLQCVAIDQALKTVDPDDELAKNNIILAYEEIATEVIYALSRVEVGGQRGSYSDGSTGIWALRAVNLWGNLSRKHLERKGLSGAYDSRRAKEWGAKGLPDNLEPDAKTKLVKTVSLVKSYKEAVAAIDNGYPVVVCSDQGFTMTRDSDGFCRPKGTWYHAMLFMATRKGRRPGLGCLQSWGGMVPDGPLALDQPDNSFFVDAEICERMLRQGDSFTGSQFDGYPAQDIVTWRH